MYDVTEVCSRVTAENGERDGVGLTFGDGRHARDAPFGGQGAQDMPNHNRNCLPLVKFPEGLEKARNISKIDE